MKHNWLKRFIVFMGFGQYMATDASFEESFRRELAKTELLRINLLIGIMIAGLTGGMINFIFLHEKEVYDLLVSSMRWLVSIAFSMIVYELLMRQFVSRHVKNKIPLSKTFRIVNIIVETSFPTLIIAVFALRVSNVIVFFSPFIMLYFLFIILSTLHLDFWMSFFTGLIAAAEYFVVSILLITFIPLPENISALLSSFTLVIARMLLIFLGGVASGFVALEIKRRVVNTNKALNDKNRIRQILGQQVSPEIVDQIILEGKHEMNTRRLYACVMFLDVRDFTPFAEKREPEEIMEFQNRLFSIAIDVINAHHGIIHQFMGDGLMATFGAAVSYGNDCKNAIDSALEILDRIQQACDEGVLHPTRLGIGIHYGQAVTGNIGSDVRRQFSITGNVVIQASRIEQLNKEFKSQLLISRDVLDKANHSNAQSRGNVMLKGESKPIEIFQLR